MTLYLKWPKHGICFCFLVYQHITRLFKNYFSVYYLRCILHTHDIVKFSRQASTALLKSLFFLIISSFFSIFMYYFHFDDYESVYYLWRPLHTGSTIKFSLRGFHCIVKNLVFPDNFINFFNFRVLFSFWRLRKCVLFMVTTTYG